jgi:hypothetical protein
MSKLCVVEDLPAELWNSFLKNHTTGNFEQCFEYGEIARKVFPRTKVVRLACMQNDELVGVLQGSYSRYFGFGVTLGLRRGPVLNFDKEGYTNVAERLLLTLESFAKKNRIITARIQVPQSWNISEVFLSLGYSLAGYLNEYIINLDNGIEYLWKTISHNKRKNIKKGMKENVEVFESRKREDLLAFYSMLQAAEKRGGFKSYPLKWFEAVWDIYKPELSKVFLTRWNNKNIAGVFTVMHSKTVYAFAAGSFSEGWKVRPNDIMHWKVMEWAYQNGYSKYHMGFVSEPLPTEGTNSWGIWRWKREWGGDLKRLQIFQKFFMPKYKFVLKVKGFVERT